MSAIGPGDWVECCPPADWQGEVPVSEVKTKGEYPQRGKIYQVREVGQYRSRGFKLCDGIRLVGIIASIPGHPDAWFPVECFRPIYRPRPEAFTDLLKLPTDAPSKEPVGA